MKRTVAAICALAFLSDPVFTQKSIPIEPPAPNDRIQLWQWTLRGETLESGGLLSDPLTQIVRVAGKSGWGTGFLLDNCRVMTALHVLIGIKHGHEPDVDVGYLQLGETLVGETYRFETQPIPWRNRQKVVGTMVILGHGTGLSEESLKKFQPKRNPIDSEDNDWAVGYDPECLSEKLSLGTFALETAYAHRMRGEPMLVAGYPGIIVTGVPRTEHPMYVDSRCTVTAHQYSPASTDCSVWHGMSGAPLLMGPLRLGHTLLTKNGRPVFKAIGIFQIGKYTPDKESLASIPNFPTVWTGAAIFNGALEKKIAALLSGPVDLDRLRKR